ncbi:hypothetical protein BDZ89DRAFT_1211246 [Hymenopellis radicata]|nr:hypothetical protein BDZ89DRAFT_1211246 [Hymenopellis radicata]
MFLLLTFDLSPLLMPSSLSCLSSIQTQWSETMKFKSTRLSSYLSGGPNRGNCDGHSQLQRVTTDCLVVDNNPSSVLFTGVKLKYVPEYVVTKAADSSFTVLAPGQSVTVSHNLDAAYNFTTSGEATYKIAPSDVFSIVDASGLLVSLSFDDCILPGGLRNHEGSRDRIIDTALSKPTIFTPDSTISPKKKQCQKLNVSQMCVASATKNTTAQQNFPTERSKDTRTEEETRKQNVIPWAKHVMDIAPRA